MKRLLLLSLALGAFLANLLAQSDIVPGSSGPPPCPPGSTDTVLLRGSLSSANESPAPGASATAPATIRIHRSLLGPYVVDFLADYQFPGAVTITGFQIRSGAAGATGALALDSGISSTAPIVSQTGSGTIQIQVAGTTATNAVLTQIVNNPGQYYAEIQTAASPNGAMRGQLAATQQSVALALMDQLSETPSIDGTGTATGAVTATVTSGATGAFTGAQLDFDVSYAFSSSDTVTGVELRSGAAGSAGAAILSLGLAGRQLSSTGAIHLEVEVDLTQPGAAAAVQALFVDPSGYYLNLLTSSRPSGAARGQLLRADRSHVGGQLNLSGVCMQYRAVAGLTFDVLRSRDGDVEAALVTFDGDFAMQPNTSIVYFGIPSDVLHTSPSSSAPLNTVSGIGNIYESVLASSAVGLKQVENILLGSGDSMLLQTAAGAKFIGFLPTFIVAGHLQISNIISGAGDASAPAAAPGGLISLFGQFPGGLPDLNPDDVTGLYNQPWPTALNGAWVTIGDIPIPIGYHSSTQIDAQVPANLAPGTYEVRYWASGELFSLALSPADQPDYRSDPYLLNILPQAPAIFVAASGPVVVHAATGAAVSQTAPAAVGESILVYVTGIAAASAPPAISAVIGGQSVPASLIPVPGYTGLQLVSLAIPAGARGTQNLAIQAGGASSNTVQLFVQ